MANNKLKIETKFTNEELKQFEEVLKSKEEGPKTIGEFFDDILFMFMKKEIGDFGKLPKYITRHGGKYSIQKNIGGEQCYFGVYPSLQEAIKIRDWIISKENLKSYSSKYLLKDGKKISGKEYVSYLTQIKKEENNKHNHSEKYLKKVPKSFQFSKIHAFLLENKSRQLGLSQTKTVQFALDLLDQMDKKEVESYLRQQKIYL